MSLTSFFTGAPAKFKVTFADADTRRTVTTKVNDREVDQFLFNAVDNVCGTVDIEVTGGKKLEHTGIKIELIGHIELLYDRANQFEFTSLVRCASTLVSHRVVPPCPRLPARASSGAGAGDAWRARRLQELPV